MTEKIFSSSRRHQHHVKGLFKRSLAVLFVLALLVPIVAGSITTSGAYDYIAYGIDVSKWQGTIDWDAVKASGIDFVILRAGTTKGKDSYFDYNYLGAKSRGINVGAYYYTYALTEAEAAAEAETVATWIAGKTFEYPIYFDIEDPSMESLSVETRTNMCIAFNSVLEEKGYFTGIYASKSWLDTYLDKATLASKYTIWEASWRNSGQADIDKSGDCQVWQYSATGSISGISGYVDLDVSYVNYPELIRRVGLNGFSKESVESTVAAYYTTTASSLNIRSGPSTDYEIVAVAPNGSRVILLDTNASGTWAKVYYNGKIGWLSDMYLDLAAPVPLEYTVSCSSSLEGAVLPDSQSLRYGAVVTAAAAQGPDNYAFKGWNLKRASDGAWYTADGGWVAESDSADIDKALITEGTKLTLNEALVELTAGDDSFVLEAVWEMTVLYGDGNGDGYINARDMIVMKKAIMGASVSESVMTALDLDGDGALRSKDSLLLKKYLGGIINKFPVNS